MTGTIAVLTTVFALGVQVPEQQQQQQQQQQQAPPAKPAPPSAAQADAAKAVTFTGCVIAAPDREDSFQLVQAAPDPATPVGTSGAPAAWAVPAYLLLGGSVSAEHLGKTVEIVGTIDAAPAPAAPAPVQADPKKAGDTTSRTQQEAPAAGQLQVQSLKIVAATCTPKQKDQQAKGK